MSTKKIKITIPLTCKEWLEQWLKIQTQMSRQNRLENETVRHLVDIITGKCTESLVVFNNAGDSAFDIWTGINAVSIIKNKDASSYIYCYRIMGQQDVIKKVFCWNRPRTYLSYFRPSYKDYKLGYVELEEDLEYEVKVWGKQVKNLPITGLGD